MKCSVSLQANEDSAQKFVVRFSASAEKIESDRLLDPQMRGSGCRVHGIGFRDTGGFRV